MSPNLFKYAAISLVHSDDSLANDREGTMEQQLSIFAATLGLSTPWEVTSASFAKESNRLDISVEVVSGALLHCLACGEQKLLTPSGSQTEVWHHDDFFHYDTYLHVQIPCIPCTCGILLLERPWCRAGSKFVQVD